MQDREIVAAVVAGDPRGIADAYDTYAMPLYSYCRSLLRQPDDAADAVQDTFLIATAKLGSLRDPGKLRPWLYAVARNECYRRLRSGEATSALDEALEVPAAAGGHASTAESVDAASVVERAELHQLVRDAINGLNPLFAGVLPLVALVPGFREHVLKLCADGTAAGLARRAAVAAPPAVRAPRRAPGAAGRRRRPARPRRRWRWPRARARARRPGHRAPRPPPRGRRPGLPRRLPRPRPPPRLRRPRSPAP